VPYEIIAVINPISFSSDTVTDLLCPEDAHPHSRAPDTPSSTR